MSLRTRGPDPNPAAPSRGHRAVRMGQAAGPDLHHRFCPQLRLERRPRPCRSCRSAAHRNRRLAAPDDDLPRSLRTGRPRPDHAQIAGIRSDRGGAGPGPGDDLAQQTLARAARRDHDRCPATAPAAQPAAPPPAPAAGQPVVLTATEAVWLQVSEKGGATLFAGVLQPGQSYPVPPSAAAPVLKTGKPEALRVTVGSMVAPAVGPAATTVADVSLLAADLLKTGQAQAPAPQATPPPPQSRATPAQPRRATAAPAPSPSPPPPSPSPTNNATGE